MIPPLFVEPSPHKVLQTKIPAPGKVTDFLKPIHSLNEFRMISIDIKEDVPIVVLCASEAIKLQRVDDTMILPAC